MFGQGSPPIRQSIAVAAGQLARSTVLLVLMAVAATPLCAEELELRMRIAWGGGDARSWVGSISLPRGTLSEPRLLGLEADEPGSIYLEGGVLRIASLSERTYEGVDLTLRGPADAEVAIDLRGREGLDSGLQLRMPLRDLIHEVHASRLDERNNRLVVRRAPGDMLRMEFQRDHLVFEPGEIFPVRLQPHWPALSPGASYTIRLRLSPARQGEELWAAEFKVTTDAAGNLAPLDGSRLTLPSKEGVYDLVATVHPWQFASAIRRSKPALQRSLQLVVIDTQPLPPPAKTDWEAAAFEIDPANPTWWDRLPRWSLTHIWPSFAQGPITHGKPARREHLGRTWIELPTEAWQAYPMGIGEPGRPHLLEIEYPSDVSQRLGISIVEPNASGRIAPMGGLDSGVIVTEESTFTSGTVVKHRLLFWPRSESPLVLLTNRSEKDPALFGKIRVMSGPAGLPPLDLKLGGEAQAADGGRLLAAYFDKPLFPENFSATDAFDEGSGRSLDDWQTFYQGSIRLVEYLKHMGYNGAIISASCEGSTIYPSKLLSPTPKYDNGAFFVTGQDPLQKDVLEMLMRIFDREGLKLIPAMQFATPVPALESLRRQGGAGAIGLEWTDAAGKRLLDQPSGSHEGLAPYYNPLHPAVRETVAAVVSELSQRYHNHVAYGGIALQAGPFSYIRLPGERWGFDDTTTAAFGAATHADLNGLQPGDAAGRASLLLGPLRQQWIAWRAAEMTTFYEQLGKAAAKSPHAKLYLADVNLLSEGSLKQALRPGLPRKQSLDKVLLEQGIDLASLRRNPQLEIMRSRRGLTDESIVQNAAVMETNDADDIKRFYENLKVSAALNYQEPDILRLPAFDAASPFGTQNTYTRLTSQFAPSAAERRREFIKTLAEGDKLSLSEGGWMLSLGQEDAVRELFTTWRSLPAAGFETLPLERTSDGGLVIRYLRQDGKTYMYLLNNVPWPVTAKLELQGLSASTPVQNLGSRSVPPLTKLSEGASAWNVPMQPYDMVAAVFSAGDVQVTSRQVEADFRVHEQLKALVGQTNGRIKALEQTPPLASLQNSGFEAPPIGNEPMPGWVYSNPATRGGLVQLDEKLPHTGGLCIRMQHNGEVAWLRSEPLTPPTTGRLAILVWMRSVAGEAQPRVHLSLDYDVGGEHRYESFLAGKGTPHPLAAGWTPYVANFDHLPTEKVSDLRVGVDCMTPGTVWIDDLEVYDKRFEAQERAQLTKTLALANFYLEQGRLGDCYHVLSSYWPSFLREMIEPPPEVAILPPQPVAQQPLAPPKEAPKEQPNRGFFDRMKSYSPTKWNPFR